MLTDTDSHRVLSLLGDQSSLFFTSLCCPRQGGRGEMTEKGRSLAHWPGASAGIIF